MIYFENIEFSTMAMLELISKIIYHCQAEPAAHPSDGSKPDMYQKVTFRPACRAGKLNVTSFIFKIVSTKTADIGRII